MEPAHKHTKCHCENRQTCPHAWDWNLPTTELEPFRNPIAVNQVMKGLSRPMYTGDGIAVILKHTALSAH